MILNSGLILTLLISTANATLWWPWPPKPTPIKSYTSTLSPTRTVSTMQTPTPTSTYPPSPPPELRPLKFGVLAFPKYVGLDIYGPLEVLSPVKFNTPNMSIVVIAETLDPVGAHIDGANGAPVTALIPTYTFDDNPELDVLMLPGGPGSRVAIHNPKLIDYVERTYPKLKYIFSVCSGAQILARAGILDGKKATTNKFSWHELVASGPNAHWIPCARWVVDGNIWTSSGVAAGMDMTHAFATHIMGNATLADRAVNIIEYEVHRDPNWDPFCQIWNTTSGSPNHSMSMSM